MATTYGQPFVGIEAKEAVYIRKNASSPILYRRGIWSDSDLKQAVFSNNSFMNVSSFSFCITIKRLTSNANSYGVINGLGYGSSQNDNFTFSITRREIGNDNIQTHLRLNDYTYIDLTTLNIGSTIRYVATYNGDTAYFWSGKNINVTKSNVIRPLNLRPSINITMKSSDFEITNVAWWTRVLTTAEKDSYFDNTMTIFQ